MLLAAPFFALGHIAWQNFLWLALFFVFRFVLPYRATALFFLAVFLLLAPANLSDFTSGGDYLTNFFYVAIAAALFIRSLDRAFYACIPAALFLGVALSSRILYAGLLIPLLALTSATHFAHSRHRFVFIVLLAAAPSRFRSLRPTPSASPEQLEQNAIKLSYIPSRAPSSLDPSAARSIVACTTFFVAHESSAPVPHFQRPSLSCLRHSSLPSPSTRKSYALTFSYF